MSTQGPKKPKRPRDLNTLAFALVEEATSDTPKDHPTEDILPEKDPLAVELGRRGGLKGGKARSDALTPEQRSEIARKAAKKRWGQKSSSAEE